MSTNVFTDEMSTDLLHHVLGLDFMQLSKVVMSSAERRSCALETCWNGTAECPFSRNGAFC